MTSNIFKSSMIYGLFMGILFAANFFISLPQGIIFRLLSFLIIILIIYAMYRFSVRYRDNECGGYISYGKAFSFILLTFFFASIISSIFKFFYFQFINPDYLTNLLQESLKIIDSMQLPVNEEFYDQMEKTMKPITYSLQSIWVDVFLGIILGLIMSAFIKKDKNIFEQE
ncbi:MAG TPA: DUF4199 domain-containing protein [Paludibacteraceae bacterium]|nr:DUF4199 domain-containing protein [Paludibacteraceae bacterium]HRU63502.1 DUF4199 domain-containing protein [Paludibacteraceae bacterium]